MIAVSTNECDRATLRWLNELAPVGIITTDVGLKITGWNGWLESHTGQAAGEMTGRGLLEALPELQERRIGQYYRDALEGQVRLLSQRFHHYLLAMQPDNDFTDCARMQQSARIAPLVEGERVIGTITLIEDVTERITNERAFQHHIVELEAVREANGKLLRSLGESETRYRSLSEQSLVGV